MSDPTPNPTEQVIDRLVAIMEEVSPQRPDPRVLALLMRDFDIGGQAAAESTFKQYVEQTGVSLPPQTTLSPTVSARAQARAAGLVTQMGLDARRALARRLVASLEKMEGIPGLAREAKAQLLQRAAQYRDPMAALTEPQRVAVANFRQKLREQGYSAADIDRLANQKIQKSIRRRARTIARTESRNMMTEGRLATENEMGAKEKRWIDSKDSLVSDICSANAAQGWIPIDQEFSSGHQTPTSHPNCRCDYATRGMAWEKVTAEYKRRRGRETPRRVSLDPPEPATGVPDAVKVSPPR